MANAFPELMVGPQDPDSTAGLTGTHTSRNTARKLIERTQANYPAEVRAAQAKPRDTERSKTLDLEEVHRLASSGEKAVIQPDDTVESASVHGTRPDGKAVLFLFRTVSGRSFRAVVPYDRLTKSKRAAEEAERRGEGRDTAVATDEEAASAVEDESERREAAEKERDDLAERLERAEDPEPYEGYDEENADDVVERIQSGGRDEFGRSGLQRMREYEARHKNREGSVIKELDAALETPPPEQG